MHGTTPGLVVLGCIRKKAEQASERGLLRAFGVGWFVPPVLALTSLHNGLCLGWICHNTGPVSSASGGGVRKQNKTQGVLFKTWKMLTEGEQCCFALSTERTNRVF